MTEQLGSDASTTTLDSDVVLAARDVKKHHGKSRSVPWAKPSAAVRAVDGLSLEVAAGETLAIVGESGCGKSSTARLLLRLDSPTEGAVLYRGRDIWELDKDGHRAYRRAVQAVFQDPSSALSPKRRVRDIVSEPLITIEGLSAKEARGRAGELLARVGLTPDVAERFPMQLSGGMKQRVAIAQALATRPEVIVLDEPVSALDVSTSAEILNLLKNLQAEYGVSFVLITHNLATVRFMADKLMSMYLGVAVETGTRDSLFANAVHPYTLALMSASIPGDDPHLQGERIILQGDLPSPANEPKGCRFQSRCWLSKQLGNPERCSSEEPTLTQVSDDQSAACHFIEESAASPQRVAILRSLGAAACGAPSPDQDREVYA